MQAPAHIQILARLSHSHSTELAMAGLAIQAICDMRAMVKIDKIRQNEHGHPLNGLIFIDSIRQLLLIGVLDWNLLVATPAFGLRWQTC